MKEWKEYKLGDLYDVHNGLSKGGKFFGTGYPFLSFKTVFNNYFLPPVLPDLVQSDEKEQSGYDIKCGDVFITRTSETPEELGMSSVALKDYPFATYNGFTKRLRPKDTSVIYPEFIGYYLRSSKFRALFYGLASSMSTRASLANGDLLGMRVFLPSFETQERIAMILKSLDNKIEVNRQINDNFVVEPLFEILLIWMLTTPINDNLEQQAQALFKSWFVDFDPFKDQTFIESELGMIPQGWKVGMLGNLIEVKYGKDHKRLSDGLYPVYGSGGLMRYVDKSLYNGESVLIPRKGTLNNVMYVNESFWTVDTMFYSIPRVQNVILFAYMFLCNKDLASMNAGSAVPSMTTEILNNLRIVLPTSLVLEKFNSLVLSLFNQIKLNNIESRRLAELRDTLLPKLMSGEINVDDVT